MKPPRFEMQKKRKRLKTRYLVILFVFLFTAGFLVGKTYSASEPSITQTPIKMGELPVPKLVAPIIIRPVEKETVVEETDVDQPDLEEKSTGKVVYLTFDDGPSRLTCQFLDVLRKNDVLATFFMQGSNLKKEPLQECVRRAVGEGHYVGGHSMTHNYKTLYNNHQFVHEMKDTLTLIHEITGTTPHLVRPPYGSAPGLKSEQIRQQLAEAGIKVWDWTIDSNDWKLPGENSRILEIIKRSTTRNREVVLMHEKIQTLEVLPEIIQFYKEQGYEFAVYDNAHHFVLNFQNDDEL